MGCNRDSTKARPVFAAVWVVFLAAYVAVAFWSIFYIEDFSSVRSGYWFSAPEARDWAFVPFLGHHWLTVTHRCWGFSLVLFAGIALAERRFFRRRNLVGCGANRELFWRTGLHRPLFTDVAAMVTFAVIVPVIANAGSDILYRLNTAVDALHKAGTLLPDKDKFRQFRDNYAGLLGPGSGALAWYLKMGIVALVVVPSATLYQRCNAGSLVKPGKEYWTLWYRAPSQPGRWPAGSSRAKLDAALRWTMGDVAPTFAGCLLYLWIVYGGLFMGILLVNWVGFWHSFAHATASPGALRLHLCAADRCGGLGGLWGAAKAAYAFVLLYGCFVAFLIWARYRWAKLPLVSSQNVAKAVVYLVLLPIVVLPPVFVLHNRLASAREQAVSAAGEAVRDRARDITGDPDTAKLSSAGRQYALLKEVYHDARACSAWPGGLTGLGGLSLGGLVPLIGPIGVEFVKRRLDRKRT